MSPPRGSQFITAHNLVVTKEEGLVDTNRQTAYYINIERGERVVSTVEEVEFRLLGW